MTPNSKRTLKQYIEDQVKREEQRIKKLEKLYEDAKQNQESQIRRSPDISPYSRIIAEKLAKSQQPAHERLYQENRIKDQRHLMAQMDEFRTNSDLTFAPKISKLAQQKKKGDKDHLYEDAIKKRKDLQAEMIRQAVTNQDGINLNTNRGGPVQDPFAQASYMTRSVSQNQLKGSSQLNRDKYVISKFTKEVISIWQTLPVDE